MNDKQKLYDTGEPGLEHMGESTDHEMRSRHLPRKPGLLETALTMLLGDMTRHNQ